MGASYGQIQPPQDGLMVRAWRRSTLSVLVALAIVTSLCWSFRHEIFEATRSLTTRDSLLSVGTNVWPGYESLYLGRDLGLLDDTTIKLVEYTSATQVIRSFRNDVIQVAGLTLDETLEVAESIGDCRIIAVLDYSNGADVLLAKPEITSLAALKGQRIGVETTALGSFMLAKILQRAGIALHEIAFVPLEVNEHEAAFRSGQVDAVITFEPAASKILRQGGKVLFSTKDIPGQIMDVLVTRRDTLVRLRPQIVQLLSGVFTAVAYQQRLRAQGLPLSDVRLQLPVDQLQKAYEGVEILDLARNRQLLGPAAAALTRDVTAIGQWMVSANLLTQTPNFERLLDLPLLTAIYEDVRVLDQRLTLARPP